MDAGGHLKQLPNLVPLAFGARSSFAIGAVLCIVGCLTASLTSTLGAPTSFDSHACLQTQSDVPWGNPPPPIETAELEEDEGQIKDLKMFTIWW